MKLKIYLLTIISLIHSTYCLVDYQLIFMEGTVFSTCAEFPENSMDSIFNMTNVEIEQTEDGTLLVNGYSVIITTVEESLPITVEIFKKENDEWKLTPYTQKRADACNAMFGKSEPWYPTLKNTPEEQLTCPFTEDQRLDFDISEPMTLSIPLQNGEGEYKVHGTAGSEGDEHFLCLDIFVKLEKM